MKWTTMSDKAINLSLGQFIREHRLRQNRTQKELATDAGISRMALNFFENGENSSLLTFIRLLRALNLLEILDCFSVEQQISPLALAKKEAKKKQRASGKTDTGIKIKSDW
jgi:transcriptional regulator with XRE-family HTH domain